MNEYTEKDEQDYYREYERDREGLNQHACQTCTDTACLGDYTHYEVPA